MSQIRHPYYVPAHMLDIVYLSLDEFRIVKTYVFPFPISHFPFPSSYVLFPQIYNFHVTSRGKYICPIDLALAFYGFSLLCYAFVLMSIVFSYV